MFGYPVQQLLAPVGRPSQETSLTLGQDDPRLTAARPPTQGAIWAPGTLIPGGFGMTEDSAPSDPERILAMAARRAMRFSATAGSSNIGGESLEQLWAETSRLAVAYPQQPLSAITGDIVSLQDIVFSLLEGRQRPSESRDLYVIGGLASGMLSKASHDLRDPDTAMTHARTALLCASNAEHASLTGWVRGLQSLITYWALRPREALEYAQLGQQLQGTTGSVTVWLASLEARAWARLGNGAASREAIARASDLREQLARNDLDEIGGMCYFSRPREIYYASDAGAALPEHDESGLREETEMFASDAVAAYEQAPGPGEVLRRRGRLTDRPCHRAHPHGQPRRSQGSHTAGPGLARRTADSTALSPASWTSTAPSRHKPQTPRSPATSRKRSKPTAGPPQRRCRASTESSACTQFSSQVPR